MLKGFVLGFLCFLIFLIIHAIIFHNWKIQRRFISLAVIFCSLLPLYVILYIAIPAEPLILIPADPTLTAEIIIETSKVFNFLLGLFIYLLLFFGYCQFYFIIDRSISVKIMIELEKSPNKKLSLEEIKKVYPGDYIFRRRLKHMIDAHYIIEDSGFYKNIRRGRFNAKLFSFLKNYLQIGEGG
jgi:hypothetical protein